MTTEVRNDETELNNTELSEQEEAERAFSEAAGEEYVPPAGDADETEEGDTPHEEGDADPVETAPAFTQADIDRIKKESALEAEQKYLKRIRDLSGEVGGLKGKLETLETARAAADAAGDAPTHQQIRDAATDSAKMDALREDFPEIADALEEAIKGVKPQNMDEITARLEAADRARESAESTAAELRDMREIRKMDKAISNWEELATSQECQSWLQTQPEGIKQAFQRTFFEEANARDAITLLEKFQRETTSPASPDLTASSRQNQHRLEQATIPTSGKSPPRRQPMTAEEAFEEAARRTMGI